MSHQDTVDAERFEQVIAEAVREILAEPAPDRFLEWARERIPSILRLDSQGLDALESSRLADLLARAVWNATPQPARDFRILPMASPVADAPCPCGSGERYRDCCGVAGDPPVLSSEVIWDHLIDLLPARAIEAALSSDAIPLPLLARVAHRWLEEEDRPGRVVVLLEPLFAEALDGAGDELEAAVDVLCGAYDRLNHWRKKQAFLQRLGEAASGTLRACAWQRLSTIRVDEGDYAGAEVAFAEALRSDPDNPVTALLEISLLAAQHKDELARRRALFWQHKLRRAGVEDETFLDFLRRATNDPQAALMDSQADVLDPVLIDLHDWVSLADRRPVPVYQPVAARIDAGRVASGQLGLFDDVDLAWVKGYRGERGIPVWLSPPHRVRRVETLWRALFNWRKPVSTQLVLPEGDAPWLEGEWSDYLLGHPEAADSLEVLDDLVNALYVHPESALPWVADILIRPLVERAWRILAQSLPQDAARHLPWSEVRNRPVLRLLFRRYVCQIEAREGGAAVETLETLLRLNRSDNHGVRGELMNQYLRAGEDGRALALARRFPDDTLADLAYGEVLALYRLGEQARARAALRLAVDRLPRIPHYLTRKRVKRPPLQLSGDLRGPNPVASEGQAWSYRESMRDVWEAEPGLLSWLKRVVTA